MTGMGMTFEFGVIDDAKTHDDKLKHCEKNHINLKGNVFEN